MLIRLEKSAGVSIREVASSVLVKSNFCFLRLMSELEDWQRRGGEYLTCAGVTRHTDARGTLPSEVSSLLFIHCSQKTYMFFNPSAPAADG